MGSTVASACREAAEDAVCFRVVSSSRRLDSDELEVTVESALSLDGVTQPARLSKRSACRLCNESRRSCTGAMFTPWSWGPQPLLAMSGPVAVAGRSSHPGTHLGRRKAGADCKSF
uniref:Uncharacterized protein n=1 Tax=Haptolina brevifila TaxID=156173 RepID=A0A7S2C2P0_9EUKA